MGTIYIYIWYMRKNIDYNITIITLTIIPLPSSNVSEYNDIVFEEFTKHAYATKIKLIHSKYNKKNVVEAYKS
jgi:hypothetical protein